MRKFNHLKNIWLKRERGASFEEVTSEGVFLRADRHPKYDGQWLEYYCYQDYVWVVVVGSDPPRFITMYKSRKLQREFGYGKKD